jgi:two-component system response regulator QseB
MANVPTSRRRALDNDSPVPQNADTPAESASRLSFCSTTPRGRHRRDQNLWMALARFARAMMGNMTAPSPRGPRVLLVEDDPELVALLSGLLGEESYEVDTALDGHHGLHLGLTRDYDVLVLDRGLPAIEGLDLLARLRAHGVIAPVLVLSALGNPADRVAGLDAGAEDYLAKPFDVDELLARLRALRRRHVDTARFIRIGQRRLDLDARMVTPMFDSPRAGSTTSLRLSKRECELLAVLASRPTRVFTRRELLSLAFENAEGESVVDTYVHYLRRKLGHDIVVTVYGRGYQLGQD